MLGGVVGVGGEGGMMNGEGEEVSGGRGEEAGIVVSDAGEGVVGELGAEP